MRFFSGGRVTGHCRGSKKQNPNDGFCKTPQVQRRLVMLPVNLHFLAGMDNVFVFHLLDKFKNVEKE